MYADDHDDTLPGPALAGATASYDKNSSWQFIYYVSTYLGLPEPSGKMQVANIFICPAFRRASGDSGLMIGRKVYLLNDDVHPGSDRIPPFGYPPTPDSSYEAPPLKMTVFDNHRPPSILFAISDLDQSHPKLNPGIGWNHELDKIVPPVHGKVRNHLFFDWHVQAVRW
jgi:hypothetical protein